MNSYKEKDVIKFGANLYKSGVQQGFIIGAVFSTICFLIVRWVG